MVITHQLDASGRLTRWAQMLPMNNARTDLSAPLSMG